MKTTKKCNSCNKIKKISDFNRHKVSIDGFKTNCRKCTIKKAKKYRRSKRGLITRLYNSQKASSKRRGYSLPSYTREELYDWMISAKKFHELFDDWIKNNYNVEYAPSVDRLDSYNPYTMGNIRITTWKENRDQYYSDVKCGIDNRKSRAVLQFSKDNVFINEFHSVIEASRRTNVSDANIGIVCSKGRLKTAGGFKWKWKN